MKNALIVGTGGFAGSVLRYKLGGLILHHAIDSRFPWGTFAINVSGCLIIGLLGGYFEKHHFISQDIKLLLFTGILGGYTTFSAFSFETVYLFKRGFPGLGILYMVASVICSVFAVWLGIIAGELIRS